MNRAYKQGTKQGLNHAPALSNALWFGLGHGGIESILLVGINHFVLLVNPELQQTLLFSTEPSLILMSGIERAFAILFHVGASMMVYTGVVQNRSVGFTIAAFALHTAINSVAVILPRALAISTWALEGLIGAMAIGTFLLSVCLWRRGRLSILDKTGGKQ